MWAKNNTNYMCSQVFAFSISLSSFSPCLSLCLSSLSLSVLHTEHYKDTLHYVCCQVSITHHKVPIELVWQHTKVTIWHPTPPDYIHKSKHWTFRQLLMTLIYPEFFRGPCFFWSVELFLGLFNTLCVFKNLKTKIN